MNLMTFHRYVTSGAERSTSCPDKQVYAVLGPNYIILVHAALEQHRFTGQMGCMGLVVASELEDVAEHPRLTATVRRLEAQHDCLGI